MEQVEKEGKKDLEEQKAIREYLLGALSNKAEMRRIEEKILLDDDFVEKLSVAEDQLIDEYLDGTLAASEQKSFDQFFLILPERKQKLRLIRDLRKYAANSENQIVRQFPKEKNLFFDWRKLISLPSFRLAAAALLFLLVGFGVWHAVFYQSDIDKGLAQLQIAYRGQRPTESRSTANFDYAQVEITRGNNNVAADEKALRRAELILSEAAENTTNAESHHALGLVFLADKKFDKALAELNLALELAPDDAGIHSDLGAVLFELGKKAVFEKDNAKGWEFFDQSQKHLERAIALDPKLLEPRFNRALCLQALLSPEEAKQAWREYLGLDSASKWAEEAKRNLENLESQKTEERSATDIERDFLIAFQEKNDGQAWQLLSRNRELIREKYLPQRLAMSYLKATGDEKRKFLAALEYAGELENKHIGDPFAGEIARFYAALPESKIDLLKQAQQAVRDGYKLCLDQKFGDALNEFTIARDLFSQADDIWEAKLSEYFIGYSLINNDQINESLVQLNQVAEFSQSRKYKWLEITALHWVAGSHKSLKQRTQAKKTYEKALALAEEIKDSYAIQRNLAELAKHSSFVGQKQSALTYLRRVLEESNTPENSLRQKYRNYTEALQILNAAKLYDAAKPISFEAVGLADMLNDQMFQASSRSNAGIACVQTGDFIEARRWINDGREKSEAIIDEKSRKKMTAYSFLASGYLERYLDNHEKSEQFYENAVKIYETLKMPFHLYAAQKGKLLNHLALGKNADLERQIPITLKLTEDYRENILEEQERTSFFDTEVSIYDIAVDYEFGKGRHEQAYNYAEISNSRSLLDFLQGGAKISGDKTKLEILIKENATPLALSEIRRQMPDSVQILQYTVLDEKVLIWLVSKEKFTVVPAKIQFSEMLGKVENYVKSLKQKNDVARADTQRLAAELYELLINPIFNQLDPTKEICLIPNKVLFYLPFASLLSSSGKTFLAEFSIFYAPSANIFLICTENARSKDGSSVESLLSVGNPAFDSRKFDKFPNLPTAEKEAQEITAFYDKPQLLIGAEATKTAFINSIKNAEIIHLAGHYVIVHDSPLSSFLLLAQNGKTLEEGILTNSELVGEKLPQAKLVILSACQTGVEHYYNGEGLVGLSRTFIAAGVPLVVASHWSVETEATAELMKRFHFYRRNEKMNTTAALRSAQLEMLNDPNGRFREPYYWAAFAAFGGYANF